MHASSTDYAFIPMGAVGLVNRVRDHGWEVRGVNLPLERGLDAAFDLDARLSGFEGVDLVLIDLHWYVHTFGAFEAARWVRTKHPDALVVFGGMTATIFDLELLAACPEVDLVIRGDAEKPIDQIVEALAAGARPARGAIWNSTFRSPLGPQRAQKTWRIDQETLDRLDYVSIEWLDNRERYLKTRIPGYDPDNRSLLWLEVGRGCFFNCTMCGGGLTAHQEMSSLPKPMYRSTDRILSDVAVLASQGIEQVAFSHDLFALRFPGLEALLDGVKRDRLAIGVYHEFWRLPQPDVLSEVFSVFDPGVSEVALSPETGNAQVRKRNFPNKPFGNEDYLRFVTQLRGLGPDLQVYFAANLPFETGETWKEATALAHDVIRGFGFERLTMYAGFLTIDPWSPMWSDPARFDINREFQGLEDYAKMTRSGRRVAGYTSKTLGPREVVENLRHFREEMLKAHDARFKGAE
jgi:radical SAM superfamily enzyme YgiQ (UPF0313 family)